MASREEKRRRLLGLRGFGRAKTNEKKYPHIVELAVGKIGLDVGLGRRIMNFHNSRHIVPRHGCVNSSGSKIYYRWCFSDLQTAHAFIEQFGGSLYEPNR